MPSSPYGSMYPRAGYWLSVVGGVLIAIVALAELVALIALPSAIANILPGHTGFVIVLAVIGVVVGLAIIFLGLHLKVSPGSARVTGILIVVLSLVSYFGFGGLFLGLVLAFIGGIAAMGWRPPNLPQTMYGLPGYNAPIRQEPGGLPWQTPETPQSTAAPAPRVCAACGAANPPTALYCGRCTARLG